MLKIRTTEIIIEDFSKLSKEEIDLIREITGVIEAPKVIEEPTVTEEAPVEETNVGPVVTEPVAIEEAPAKKRSRTKKETPVEEPKAEETPVEEPKAEETPVEEPKAEETPVVEETPAHDPAKHAEIRSALVKFCKEKGLNQKAKELMKDVYGVNMLTDLTSFQIEELFNTLQEG